ncbi:MAG: transcription antitermination factor NusB, partial [Propionibacteriaceae bacterium]|nr:transcription antitermination factor NusB [Propionibacteriaceae bacterium]
DSMIAAQLPQKWTIQRMPRVDRILARLACYEMSYDNIEPPIAISQAVTLAQELSTEKSSVFLNGVLAAVAKEIGR